MSVMQARTAFFSKLQFIQGVHLHLIQYIGHRLWQLCHDFLISRKEDWKIIKMITLYLFYWVPETILTVVRSAMNLFGFNDIPNFFPIKLQQNSFQLRKLLLKMKLTGCSSWVIKTMMLHQCYMLLRKPFLCFVYFNYF